MQTAAFSSQAPPALAVSFNTLTPDFRHSMEIVLGVEWRVVRGLAPTDVFTAGRCACAVDATTKQPVGCEACGSVFRVLLGAPGAGLHQGAGGVERYSFALKRVCKCRDRIELRRRFELVVVLADAVLSWPFHLSFSSRPARRRTVRGAGSPPRTAPEAVPEATPASAAVTVKGSPPAETQIQVVPVSPPALLIARRPSAVSALVPLAAPSAVVVRLMRLPATMEARTVVKLGEKLHSKLRACVSGLVSAHFNTLDHEGRTDMVLAVLSFSRPDGVLAYEYLCQEIAREQNMPPVTVVHTSLFLLNNDQHRQQGVPQAAI